MRLSRPHRRRRLNAGLQAGLGEKPVRSRSTPFVVRASPMGLRAGFDPAGVNQLGDDLEAEDFLKKPRRTNKA
ncbi:MAG: hypothetical protein HY017_03400 [Betaproteobacteria bacterium]|nr:hypothetical protein [Betaproteobacteria bacterium]